MMTPARQRVWFEKMARSIGGDSARDSQPPDRPLSQDRSAYGEGEPMQIVFSRVMYLRRHHKTGNVAAERRYRVATDPRL